MLVVKRMRQRASVFVALVAVAAIGSGVLLGILGMLDRAEVDGVRAQLADRAGADRVLELSLGSDPDGSAQNARVESLLSRVFARGDRVLPVDVTHTLVSDSPVALSTGVKAFVASVPDLESHATLVDGEWPRSAGEASVQADAATALGLSVGDPLAAGDAEFVVTGTWRVSDPVDPRWVSDSLFLDGYSGVVLGPITVSESDLPSVGAITNTRWAIVPRGGALRAGDLDVFLQGWSSMADSLRADGGFNVNSLHFGGRFANVASSIQSNVSALGAVAPVALLILAALTALTLVELGRLLANVRRDEYLLFWSRGDTMWAIGLRAGGEAAAVALLGALLGGIAATSIGGEPAGPLAVAVSAAIAFVAAVIFAISAVGIARAVTQAASDEYAARSVRITGVAAPVLLSVGAAISTWQLLLYGSPLSPTRDGDLRVDPIAVVAPTLCLLALVATASAVAPIAASVLDRTTARSSRPALVVRTLARRTPLFAAAFVLCALVVGQLTIASAYAQTWGSAYATAASIRAGSSLTIQDFHAPLTQRVIETVEALDSVTAVAPVYSEPVKVGATPASLIAVAPPALSALGSEGRGLIDTTAAAAQIALPRSGPLIPSGTRRVVVTGTSGVGLDLVIADEFGVQREVRATGSYEFEMPTGRGDWKVLAFIIRFPKNGPSSFAVTRVVADGVEVDLAGGWSAQGFDPLRAPVIPDPSGAGFSDAAGLESVRLTPLFGHLTDEVHPAVVISRELADVARLRVGDIVPVAFDARSTPFACTVAAIIPAIPGAETEPAVLMDASLVEAVRARFYLNPPTPQAAWIEGDDSSAGLEQVRAHVPPGVLVNALSVDANHEMLGAATRALWVGAGGAGILYFISVAASVGVQVRLRRSETFVLRALGVSEREIASGRRVELAIVIALGVVVGVAAGLIVAALTIGPLARAAVPGSYDAIATVIRLHPFGLAVGLGVLVLGSSVGLYLYGRRVLR